MKFPVLRSWASRVRAIETSLLCPDDVPWAMLAPHEKQALHNHDQTLKRLAERGGLSPCEMLAVLENRPWRQMPLKQSILQLRRAIEVWYREQAVEICRSRRYETGEGTCAALCMQELGNVRDRPGGCPYAMEVHKDKIEKA